MGRLKKLLEIAARISECLEEMDPELRRKLFRLAFKDTPSDALEVEQMISGSVDDQMQEWAVKQGMSADDVKAIVAG